MLRIEWELALQCTNLNYVTILVLGGVAKGVDPKMDGASDQVDHWCWDQLWTMWGHAVCISGNLGSLQGQRWWRVVPFWTVLRIIFNVTFGARA